LDSHIYCSPLIFYYKIVIKIYWSITLCTFLKICHFAFSFSFWCTLWSMELRCICKRGAVLQLRRPWSSRLSQWGARRKILGQLSANQNRKPSGKIQPEILHFRIFHYITTQIRPTRQKEPRVQFHQGSRRSFYIPMFRGQLFVLTF
jgi:hypothetical protein